MALRFARRVHPGEFLREEYFLPLAMTPEDLANRLSLPRGAVQNLLAEETALTPDMALRLARLFRTTPEFWLNFQTAYDLDVATRELGKGLDAIVPIPTPDKAA